MMVLMPICRSSAKRSRMPPLTMSRSSMTPSARRPSATTIGVAPVRAIVSTDSLTLRGPGAALLLDELADRVGRAFAQAGGRRGRRRSCASAPRTCGTCATWRRDRARAAGTSAWRARRCERPSGVSSASEASCAASASSCSVDARRRHERERLAIAERDRAGLVEQQHVDVAGRFDRAAGRRDDVGAHHAIHAGDADGRQQARRSSSESGTPAARRAPSA